MICLRHSVMLFVGLAALSWPGSPITAAKPEDAMPRVVSVKFLRNAEPTHLEPHGFNEITAIAFHPNSRLFATASVRGNVCIWDASAGKLVRKLARQRGPDLKDGKIVPNDLPHPGGAYAVCFSPDGAILASGGQDAEVVLWDVGTGQEVNRFHRHPDPVTCVAFSPDGTLLAVGGYPGVVCLWEIKTDKLIRKLQGHEDRVSSVSFSPDGSMLVAGGMTRWAEEIMKNYIGLGPADFVRVWDVKTGKELRKFAGRGSAALFSPDGKLVASGGSVNLVDQRPDELGINDASLIHVWDSRTGEEKLKLRDKGAAVAFTPDSRFLLAMAGPVTHDFGGGRRGDGTKLYDLTTGKVVLTFEEKGLIIAAISPDGKFLAGGTHNATAFVCELPDLNATR